MLLPRFCTICHRGTRSSIHVTISKSSSAADGKTAMTFDLTKEMLSLEPSCPRILRRCFDIFSRHPTLQILRYFPSPAPMSLANAWKHSYFSPMQLAATDKSVDEQNFDKMKAVYDACLNEDIIKKAGTAPLVDVAKEILHSFPVTDSGSIVATDDKSLKDTVLYLAKLGITSLVATGTGADDTDPDTVVVSIAAPYRIGLPAKERYEDEKVVARYKNVLSQVLSALFPEQGISNSTVDDVVAFEKKLAASSPDAEERDDVTKYYNPYSLDEASKLTPQLDLASIINDLAPAGSKVDRVIVMAPQYQKDLADTLSNTSQHTLQTYFVWKAVQSLASYIEADAVLPYKRFSNELAGKVRQTRFSFTESFFD